MALCDLVELLIIDYKFPEGNFLFYRTLTTWSEFLHNIDTVLLGEV